MQEIMALLHSQPQSRSVTGTGEFANPQRHLHRDWMSTTQDTMKLLARHAQSTMILFEVYPKYFALFPFKCDALGPVDMQGITLRFSTQRVKVEAWQIQLQQ